MTERDFDKFSAIMVGIAENYGQSLSPSGIALRFKTLEQHDIDEIERAAMSLITCRKYTTMPTVADFLEHLSCGSLEDKAEVEAGKVLTAIARHGGYASVVFDDPVTQAVIVQAYGGWVKLCEECGSSGVNGESEKWFRKDFARTWAAYSRQGIQQHGHLPGRFEISNSSNGYLDAIPAPQLIGDPTKAKAVLEGGAPLALTSQKPVNRGECLALADVLEPMKNKA
jgi:hypothetical protein